MILKTSRLILRPWKETDAEDLYELAKNPHIGPIAGWPVHTNVENSAYIIREILSAEHTFAVTIRNKDNAVGSIGLMVGGKSNLDIGADEAEIGYWIGEPYWGRGYIPEAVRELMRYAFDELNLLTVWCGYFDENERSKRVCEKCGFRFHHTEHDRFWPPINESKTQHIACLTREEWLGSFGKQQA
ncbi:MAG: GNAT family N-acetyltransferase [Candidatus Methanoplasma sp.]|jgi:RimJ/RimL family protein N-acetyltransferase|nr:GNAT family N-acetyltransferase [Candidatus Methanoplasma sp.]